MPPSGKRGSPRNSTVPGRRNSTVRGRRNHACAAENVHEDRRVLLQLTRMARGAELTHKRRLKARPRGRTRGARHASQQAAKTPAKADSAAEHRRLLRRLTRTVRAGEAPQQTAGSGVAYAANARMRRCSRQRQEAGQWPGVIEQAARGISLLYF